MRPHRRRGPTALAVFVSAGSAAKRRHRPTRKFVGVLKGPGEPATSFKYYVTREQPALDPIIIVDR